MTGETALLDCTTETNMDMLIEIGKKLLDEPVANIDRGSTSPSRTAPPTRRHLRCWPPSSPLNTTFASRDSP